MAFFLISIKQVLAQDTLNLKKFYPKPKIAAVELFIGINSSSIRGISSTIGNAGNGVYYATKLSNKIGYTLGVGLIHRYSKHFELNARFLWETKGANQKKDSISIDLVTGDLLGTATISSQSINSKYAIISISPQFVLGKKSQFKIGIGGYFSILHDSKSTIKYYYPVQYSVIQNGYFNKYDYGLQFNAGYKFNFIKSTQFYVQFIYSYGLEQISEFHDLYTWAPPLYNNSYSIVLGVRLVNTKRN